MLQETDRGCLNKTEQTRRRDDLTQPAMTIFHWICVNISEETGWCSTGQEKPLLWFFSSFIVIIYLSFLLKLRQSREPVHVCLCMCPHVPDPRRRGLAFPPDLIVIDGHTTLLVYQAEKKPVTSVLHLSNGHSSSPQRLLGVETRIRRQS